MMTKKTKRMLIIIPTVLVIILLISIYVVLYLNTDMFKSAKTLFSKYAGKNIENIEMIQELLDNSNNERFNTDKFVENSEVELSFTKNPGTSSESKNNNINKLKFIIDGQIDRANNYEYQNIQLLKEDNLVSGLELINDENEMGIKFSNLFKQYIFAEDTNFKGILEKMGYTEEELENIPDTIDINKNILNECKFTTEEIESLKRKYISIMNEEISSDKFKEIQRQNITINEKKVEVDGYVLKLTREQLNSLYVKILEELKKDEIILNKLNLLQNNIKIINQVSPENIDLSKIFVSKIEDKILEINQNNIGGEETSITVYKNLGKTVRTTISASDYDLNFDFFETSDEKYVQIAEKKVESTDYRFNIEIKNKGNNLNIEYDNNAVDNPYKISFEKNINEEDEELKQAISIIYENEKSKFETKIFDQITFVDEFEDDIAIDDNFIQLESLSDENLKIVSDKIHQALQNEKNKIKQEVVTQNEINEIFNEFGLYHDKEKLDGNGVTEAEKNRYNAKYEILRGEGIERDGIINVIDTIKDSFVNIETISSTELKLEIKKDQGNEELADKLKKYIEEKRRTKYSISVEYDENGLVKYLILKILENS